jgi:hypothetical protein
MGEMEWESDFTCLDFAACLTNRGKRSLCNLFPLAYDLAQDRVKGNKYVAVSLSPCLLSGCDALYWHLFFLEFEWERWKGIGLHA